MQYLKGKVEEHGCIQDMILVRLSAMEGVIQDLQNVGADKKQQSDQATNTEHCTPISAHKSLEHPPADSDYSVPSSPDLLPTLFSSKSFL